MSLNDPLANVLSAIVNSDKIGKPKCQVTPSSNIILKVLSIMKDNAYIGSFEIINKRFGGVIEINLLGRVNKCGVVKPRFSFTSTNSEKFERRYLPAKGFGILIVSTSKGIMTNKEAVEKAIGGKLIAYCY